MGCTLAGQKDAVIPLCFDILDTDDLYDEAALGGGDAPANAARLLGHWRVREVVPHLLRLLEEHDVETEIYTQGYLALAQWGPDILEDVLRFAETVHGELLIDLAAIITRIGQGDDRAYAWIKAQFDEQRSEDDIQFWAEMLLESGGEAAIAHLEARILKRRKYSLRLRNTLTNYIQNVREGGRP